MNRAWDDLLTEQDRAIIARAKFGRRIGMGSRPAVIVIDVQNYMVGPPEGSTAQYPSACGPVAKAALMKLGPLLATARERGVPVIYTQFVLARDGSDIGAYGRKRDLLKTEGWCLEESEGAEVHADVAPQRSDIVLVKKKPSAFHGTPLLGLLIQRGIDTLLVTGGSTSNCVRATVVDSTSYNYRTLVIEDCVFDRFDISHRVALFDMDRQYADVLPSEDAIRQLETLGSDNRVSASP
jgi:maleamate amidohydrolase